MNGLKGFLGVVLLLSAQLVAAQRSICTINDNWSFTKMAGDVGSLSTVDDDKWDTVTIPHTWNDKDAFDDKAGYGRLKAWYSNFFFFDQSLEFQKNYLYFEASNQVTEVFVNGKLAGKHNNGYTSFCLDISSFITYGADNTIEISVDNTHNKSLAPLSADFTFFGGIYRDLSLVTTNAIHFDTLTGGSSGVYIATPTVSEAKAELTIRSKFFNESKRNESLTLTHTIIDGQGQSVKTVVEQSVLDPGQSTTVSKDITLENPHLWSPSDPYLYSVVSTISQADGTVLDTVKNPLGCRWFRFDAEKGFFINGENLKLFGTNRHQDYPGVGNAVADELHRFDMKMLKEMGINCLRIAHYPQDSSVLEMCDQLGFIVFEEIPIVNEITQTEAFTQSCAAGIREMIARDYNHPSVVAWNISNEILLTLYWNMPTDLKQYQLDVRTLLQKMDKVIREEDPTRLTMNVNHGHLSMYVEANLLDITQIIGWNHYSGWFGSKITNFDKFVEDVHKEHPDTAFVITEYGAGADPRVHSLDPGRFDFSVEYQNYFNQHYMNVIMKTDYIAGANVWNYADFSSELRKDAVPHINNKGLVTYDRRPKDSYYYYQARLLDEPVVVIPSKLWVTRAGIAHSETELFSKQSIEVYANLDQVELFLNEVSLGSKKLEDKVATWDVPFVDGENILRAVGHKDGKKIEDELKVDFTLYPRDLKSKDLPFSEIAINVGSKCYFIDDKQQNYLWMPDKQYEKGNWGYMGARSIAVKLISSARIK